MASTIRPPAHLLPLSSSHQTPPATMLSSLSLLLPPTAASPSSLPLPSPANHPAPPASTLLFQLRSPTIIPSSPSLLPHLQHDPPSPSLSFRVLFPDLKQIFVAGHRSNHHRATSSSPLFRPGHPTPPSSPLLHLHTRPTLAGHHHPPTLTPPPCGTQPVTILLPFRWMLNFHRLLGGIPFLLQVELEFIPHSHGSTSISASIQSRSSFPSFSCRPVIFPSTIPGHRPDLPILSTPCPSSFSRASSSSARRHLSLPELPPISS